MADKEEDVKESQKPDGETQNADASDGADDPDGKTDNKLEESASPELAKYIKELRTEQVRRNKTNQELKGELDKLKSDRKEEAKRLKALEDKDKSEEDLKAERLKELEETAGKLPELEKYHKHVKALYGRRIKAVKEAGEEVQASIDSLLEDMPKDDFLGRLKVIDAVLAVAGKKKEMPEEDVGNPAETGDGESGKTLAGDLAWSPMGQHEAGLAGLTKTSE